jgi:hypothetical protein
MSIYKLIRWSPRILSMLLIALLMMFSLDVFESGMLWYEILLGLLIHNIPAFVLILVLVISWKKPLVGAIVFTTVGFLYGVWMILDRGFDQWLAVLSLGVPAIIIGILFYMDYKLL